MKVKQVSDKTRMQTRSFNPRAGDPSFTASCLKPELSHAGVAVGRRGYQHSALCPACLWTHATKVAQKTWRTENKLS